MDFKLTEEEEGFRQEVRDFIVKELPPDWTGPPWIAESEKETEESWQFARDFTYKLLVEKKWLIMQWPKEYGGQGASPTYLDILNDEIAYWRAPMVDCYGPYMVGPTLINFGTEEQKKEHLPRILSGKVLWTQGFSEPDAGSDLASVKTTAKEEEDCFVINGQKTWSSIAHRADWMFVLARTDPQAPRKHEGLSLFYLDMKTPGISFSPLVNIARNHTFNDVFFDNVRVPKKNLVGEKNRGWNLTIATLDYERTWGITKVGGAKRWLEELTQFINDKKRRGEIIPDEAILRDRLAQLAVYVEVWRLLAYRMVHMLGKGRLSSHEAAIQYAFGNEFIRRLHRVGMQILSLYGQLGVESKWAPLKGMMERDYLYSPAFTLGGGTSEIQRNIIALRGLGLPRG